MNDRMDMLAERLEHVKKRLREENDTICDHIITLMQANNNRLYDIHKTRDELSTVNSDINQIKCDVTNTMKELERTKTSLENAQKKIDKK